MYVHHILRHTLWQALMKHLTNRILHDSLYRNSLLLMLSTVAMGGFGFLFWLISAKFVSPEEIGLAGVLIVSMNFIAMFSMVGMDNAVVRFLSNSAHQAKHVSTAMITVAISGFLFGSLFLLLLNIIAPKLAFVGAHPGTAFVFVLLCVGAAINTLIEPIFVAYRKAKYALLITCALSAVKIFLPLFFYPFGAFGIFAAAALAQIVGAILGIWVLVRRFHLALTWSFDKNMMRSVWGYSTGTYIAGVLNLIPMTVIPLLITDKLGAAEAGYFYVVSMIANLLYVIPQATARSLFAEGSFDLVKLGALIRQAVRMLLLLLVPAGALLFALRSPVLQVFGESYKDAATSLFGYFILASIALAITAITAALHKLHQSLGALIALQLVFTVSTTLFTLTFIDRGLTGVGLAWLCGNMVTACVACAQLAYVYRSPS